VERMECSTCGNSFKNKNSLAAHVSSKHRAKGQLDQGTPPSGPITAHHPPSGPITAHPPSGPIIAHYFSDTSC
jgi:hypothetical protein